MSRYRIEIELWAKKTMFEGKRFHGPVIANLTLTRHLDLEIADAELLAAEWMRSPSAFEQEAARSIRAALREREELFAEEDMESVKT